MTAAILVPVDAERELLGALAFHGPAALARLREILPGAEAWSAPLRRQAEVLLSLAAEGSLGEMPLVRARAFRLGYTDLGETVEEWLAEVTQGLGLLETLDAYAHIVLEGYRRRMLRDAAQRILTATEDATIPVDATLGAMLDAVTPHVAGHRAKASHDHLDELALQLAREVETEALPGLSTGIAELDDLIDGWQPERLIVLAARPGFGKTASAIWFADHVARHHDEGVLFVTCEQPIRQIQRRRLQMRLGHSLRRPHELAQRLGAERLQQRLQGEIALMRAEPLGFFSGARTPRDIRLELQRRIALGEQPKVVVVDYLTKLRADEKSERHDLAVGSITSALCTIAKDFQVTVLLLAQLNRESVKDGKQRRPTVADLRDSGIIEQDADVVGLLWPGAIGEDGLPGMANGVEPFEILVAKNRHGPKGDVRLDWWPTTGRLVPRTTYALGRAA